MIKTIKAKFNQSAKSDALEPRAAMPKISMNGKELVGKVRAKAAKAIRLLLHISFSLFLELSTPVSLAYLPTDTPRAEKDILKQATLSQENVLLDEFI